MLAKYWRGVTETKRAFTLRKESCGGARNRRCHIWTKREQAAIRVCETKRSMSFIFPHPALEESKVVNRRRDDLFVGPTGKDLHDRVFYAAAQTRFCAEVVPHAVW